MVKDYYTISNRMKNVSSLYDFMKIDHIGIEVRDLYTAELFYRKVLGFVPIYRYVSGNSPGLRTVFLERQGAKLELLERPRDESFLFRRTVSPNHFSLSVDDVDAFYRQLVSVALPAISLRPPRDTGDGFREMELRDPEGNVIEIAARIHPAPSYPVGAVIFDLDGTLVDSEENYYLADKKLLERHGIAFSEEDKKKYIGGGNREMMIDLKERFDIPESAEELCKRKDAIYLEIALADTRVYPEMERFLEMLRAKKVPTAVASGSAPLVLKGILAAVGLADRFDVVVSADEVKRGKPQPDVFLEAAARLGVPPHHCLVVEDSRHGVEAAKRAFMRCIAIAYLTEKPLADSFLMADLLFEDGMATFDANRAFSWVEQWLGDAHR
jgi:HAD superfamily hydrolase (TIGR01509 family)